MMRYFYLGVVALLLVAVRGGAQVMADRVVVRVVDEQTGAALPAAVLRDVAGNVVAHADSVGYLVLPLNALQPGGMLVAMCYGYRPDTLRAMRTWINMRPLAMQLPEATVTNSKVTKVLHAPNEYVVDYQPVGKDIIVASYSGNAGGKAKLFVLNSERVTTDTCKLPAEPVSLYKSCVGRYYCVCTKGFYPLQLWGNGKVTLQPPYDNSMLPGLQECQVAVHGNHYYRLGDKENFVTEYGVILKDDSIFKHIARYEQANVARASMEELMEILALLEMGQFNKAAKKQMLRNMWNKASYAHMDMPLYAVHDTLVIFDYFSKRLLLCNLNGDSVGTVPIKFRWRDAQHFKVLQDGSTGKLYLHRYDEMGAQTIEELWVSNASCGGKVVIGKPFAEDVKVYNGDIYFLWQDKGVSGTGQLYVQRSEVAVVKGN